MDDITRRSRKSIKPAGRALVFALIGHIEDPETGERLIDDPVFRAAAGIRDELKRESA